MLSLCIDEGNTAIKFGLFKEDELIHSGQGLDILSKVDFSKVSRCIIATVLNDSNAITLLRAKSLKFMVLSAHSKLPFSLLYQTPDTLGADRLAVIAGALSKFRNRNNLVITMGTCITYNFLNAKNEFIGGAISPGVHLRLKSMHHFTSKLPLVPLPNLRTIDLIGSDTNQSILSGAVNGAVAELAYTISLYAERFDNLNILATGGDASFLVSQFKNNIFADPELQLKGLNNILQLNAD